jgi:hypothetical protein
MLLTGESTDSFNGIEHPARVVPREINLSFKQGLVDLPPHSLLIVSFPSK